MRGKAYGEGNVEPRVRITPAYAGKSKSGEMTVSHSGDHPRLCGEKAVFCNDIKCCMGSPPPMRGKEIENVSAPLFAGITPAYAGKSTGLVFDTWNIVDHPRLCGEKLPAKWI